MFKRQIKKPYINKQPFPNNVNYSNPRFHWIQSETNKQEKQSLTIVNIHKSSSPISANFRTLLNHHDINPSMINSIYSYLKMHRIHALSNTLTSNPTAGLKGNYTEQVPPLHHFSARRTNSIGLSTMDGVTRIQSLYWRMMDKFDLQEKGNPFKRRVGTSLQERRFLSSRSGLRELQVSM
jgi:hypothetical protein